MINSTTKPITESLLSMTVMISYSMTGTPYAAIVLCVRSSTGPILRVDYDE